MTFVSTKLPALSPLVTNPFTKASVYVNTMYMAVVEPTIQNIRDK